MANRSTSTRVSNPPGGVSNIFLSEPADTPRKVRDNQKSSIFSADEPDNIKRNSSSPRHQDTKNRLFGDVDTGASPRRVTDTWRSNVVFSASADCLSDDAKRTPKRSPSAGINPITGEVLVNGSQNQEENGACQPFTNGNGLKPDEMEENDSAKHNGLNGHQNGHMKNGKPAAASTRQPPGGKSSGIFG